MDLSAIQPEAAPAQSGIFAMFLPANAGGNGAPASLFESLLQDALGLAGGTPPAMVNGTPESSAQIAGDPASLVLAQPKGEGHKKQESKSGGSAEAFTPVMLTVAPVPMEALQKLDQAAWTQAGSSPAPQAQPISELVPGTSLAPVPSLGTSFPGVTGKATKPSDRPQTDASAATKERLTGGFAPLPSSSSPDGSAAMSEGLDIGPIVPGLAEGKLAQKITGHSEKSDEQDFKTHTSGGSASGNMQIPPASSAPVTKQFPPLTSEATQQEGGRKPVANAMGHSGSINTTTTPNQQPSRTNQENNVSPAAAPLSSPQGGLNLTFAANLSVNDGASPVMEAVANATPQAGTAQLQRDPSSSAPLNSGATAFSAALIPAVPFQAGKSAQELQAPAVASLKVQPKLQTESQFHAQPAMQYQHSADHAAQSAVSGFIPAKNPADLLKSVATSVSTQGSAAHHGDINIQAAENRAVAKTDAPATSAGSAPTNSTATRAADHKLNQADQANSAPQSAQATATPSPAQAVTPAAANAPASPAGVPAAASQPVAASPSQTLAPKPAAHDLPAALSDPSVPVQVHAARMFQADGRSEMRLDMQTQAFGGVEVHTSVSGKDVQLSVSAEHGDLRSFLAPEMPVLQSNLQQHDLRLQQVRTVLNTGTQREFSSGSEQQEQRFARSHPRPGMFDQHDIAGSPEEEDSPKGLSIRI